uniref:Uncharacterized protein n=1 Tax=Anguilla anguilla TaxID=7936 RepID=A0A0E9WT67_ANGAN
MSFCIHVYVSFYVQLPKAKAHVFPKLLLFFLVNVKT